MENKLKPLGVPVGPAGVFREVVTATDIASCMELNKGVVGKWIERYDSFPDPVTTKHRLVFYLQNEVDEWLIENDRKYDKAGNCLVDWGRTNG